LTEGKPALTSVEASSGFAPDEVLRLAASLEVGSEHPLATAILRGAEQKGLKAAKVEDFEAVPGQGVKGRIDGRIAGSAMRVSWKASASSGPARQAADARRKQGETVMYLAVDGKLAGFVAVADPIKPSAAEAIAKLHSWDSRSSWPPATTRRRRKAVAARLGIDEVRAG
jgi:Cu+-exporting ATPase